MKAFTTLMLTLGAVGSAACASEEKTREVRPADKVTLVVSGMT